MLLTSFLTKTSNNESIKLFYFSKLKISSKFSIGYLKSKGISRLSGQKVLKSKGRNKYKNTYKIFNASFLGFLTTAVLLNYYKLPQKKIPKVVALFYNTCGGWFLNAFTTNMFFSSYVRFFPSCTKNYNSFLNVSLLFTQIICLKNGTYYTIISMLGKLTKNSIKFIKASGSKGILFLPVFFKKWAVVLLPSQAYKIVSNFNYYAHTGVSQLAVDSKIRVKNAGFNVNRGKKPTVRGTVKNPCDHPNGGRSRSLQLARTPWGFPTKKSRKSSLNY